MNFDYYDFVFRLWDITGFTDVSVLVHQDSNNINQDEDSKDDIDDGGDNLSGHPGCHLHQNQTRYI